ncbi:MAG: hypothetical protein KY475_11105 [Planctomycetes bacterium]|nr:hypothetical protein [Planctomycetota bacterium]
MQAQEMQANLPRHTVQFFNTAIAALGRDLGLELLGGADIARLERRVWTLEYLRSESTPLYSLDELLGHLCKFHRYEEEIAPFLIRTGLPPRTFHPSAWLSLHLGRLYDTRCTSSPYPPNEQRAGNRKSEPPYRWIKYPKHSVVTLREIERCEYEEADVLPGMKPYDAKRLEAERPRFLSARNAVLAELVRALAERKSERLLERCLANLDAMLDRDHS